MSSVSLAIVLSLGVQAGASLTPERQVQGNAVTSARDPEIVLEIARPAVFVGSDRWILYGVADCEIHVFVEATNRSVTRLYWIQFEAYLPQVPASYTGYTSPRRATIAGREFIVDGGLFQTDAPSSRPDSDRERVLKLLAAKGFRLPAAMITQRMVHLPDPEKRKELMIIYAEDLAPTGYTLADLRSGGKAAGERPRLEQALLDRALQRITGPRAAVR